MYNDINIMTENQPQFLIKESSDVNTSNEY